ncbi:DNA primase [Candidatus Woesearchaeota archaeon]|nr:DNA primase [Candidatus Woesearchaeota archaeon]
MGKIAQVSAKYIINASIDINGVVEKPDVIGAIFGQTEGLLGADLELRELQRSGRIGRIEVNLETKGGKTKGTIIIPSSLDKAETCIVAAALETMERIGPCNARVRIEKIEDVRVAKRMYIIERAKELLKQMMETVMPDSQEISDEVAASVRMMEIQQYGKERLPAGPNIDDSEEIIVVEGRADVLNLLKYGFKNVIAINGTSVPQTIQELSKQKVVTAFVDGDRGGILILRELLSVAEVDYVARAPDGKEVEELTKKEIHKALRSRVSAEQVRMEIFKNGEQLKTERQEQKKETRRQPEEKTKISQEEKKKYAKMLEELIGTRGAYLIDNELSILGKVPITELQTTIKSLEGGIHAVVMDGPITRDLFNMAEKAGIKVLVGMSSKVKPTGRVEILTIDNL